MPWRRSSPQLLELSGIGNPTVLKDAGIECKVSNPNVGENLQEHMMTAMIYEIDPSIVTPEDLRADPALAAAADEEYRLHATGPRTAIPSSVAYLPFTHFIPAQELSQMTSKTADPRVQNQLPLPAPRQDNLIPLHLPPEHRPDRILLRHQQLLPLL